VYRIFTVLALIVLAGCYQGGYRFLYAGTGNFKEVGECLYTELGGPDAIIPVLKSEPKQHIIGLPDNDQTFVIFTRVADYQGGMLTYTPRYGLATANEIQVRQMTPNDVIVYIDHAPDWSWAAGSGLSRLTEDYIYKCLPDARLMRSR